MITHKIKRTICFIDLFKFIASIMVFSMHCKVLEDYGISQKILEIFTRWGVPFFFISSGYFLFSRGNTDNIPKEELLRYIKRIGFLYLCWFVFNLPNIVYLRIWGKSLSSMETWVILLRDFFLSSTFTGSWFLVSSIFSAWLVWILSKKFKSITVLGFTFICYILCILSCVSNNTDIVFLLRIKSVLKIADFPFNIFNGCVFFALGKIIKENEDWLRKRYKAIQYLCVVCVSYGVFSCLHLIKGTNGEGLLSFLGSTDASVLLLPISFSIFIICLFTPVKIKNSYLLRKISVIVFCAQGNVLCIRGVLVEYLHMRGSVVIYCICCLAMMLIVSIVIYLWKNKQKEIPWIQYMC